MTEIEILGAIYSFVVMASYILGYFVGRATKEDEK